MTGSMWRSLLAVSALTLVTAACGGGGDDTEPADADVTGANATGDSDAVSDEPIRVMVADPYGLFGSGPAAAVEWGIYEDLGVNVEFLTGQEVVEGLASGDVDVGISSPNRFIGAIAAGLDAKILGPTTSAWQMAVVVRDDLGVSNLEEWEGGKLGISRIGSAGHYAAEKLASEMGWEEGQYEIVTMGGLDELIAGLRTGVIDGFTWDPATAYRLEEEGEAVILGFVTDLMGENPLNVIAASGTAINERPDAVRAVCEGMYEAQRRYQENPEEAVSLWLDAWGFEESQDATRQAVEAAIPLQSTNDEITDEMFENMAEATRFTIEGIDENLSGSDVKAMYVPCSSL